MADERAEEIGYFLRERGPYSFFTNYKNVLIIKMIYILEYMHFLLPFSKK